MYLTEPKTKKWKTEKKLKSKKTDMLRSIGKQSGESVESVRKKKRRLRSEGFAKKEGFSLFSPANGAFCGGNNYDLELGP